MCTCTYTHTHTHTHACMHVQTRPSPAQPSPAQPRSKSVSVCRNKDGMKAVRPCGLAPRCFFFRFSVLSLLSVVSCLCCCRFFVCVLCLLNSLVILLSWLVPVCMLGCAAGFCAVIDMDVGRECLCSGFVFCSVVDMIDTDMREICVIRVLWWVLYALMRYVVQGISNVNVHV